MHVSMWPTILPSSSFCCLTATAFIVWIAHKAYKRIAHIRRLSFLPGPPTVSHLWGHAFDLRGAPTGTRYNVWREQYGPVYLIRDPLMEPILVMGDTKGASHILNNTSKYWRPDIDKSILTLWFGASLLSSEAESHSRRRQRLNPAFTPQSVKQVSHVFFDLAHHLRANWDDKIGPDESVVINVSEALHSFSLNAISMTMFAHDLSASSSTIPALLANLSNGPSEEDTPLNRIAAVVVGAYPQMLSLPNPMKTWANMLKTELGKIAQEAWDAAQRDETVGRMDAKVLEVLNQDRKAGDSVSRDDVVAEIIGLIFAGSETIANVMGELLYELSRQPIIQSRLRAELIEFEVTHGAPPSYIDLAASGKNGLEYLEAITMETMRCKAVVMDISRQAVVEDVIPLNAPLPGSHEIGLRVHPGQIISIPVRDGVNVDPTVWGDDADEFKPERWLEKRTSNRGVGPGSMLTFGDGGKVCIGRAFALAEFKIVTSVLVRHFSFHLAEGQQDVDFYHLGGNTVKPKVRGKERQGVMLPIRVRRG
ncbi:cytochrome P450 [Amylostereum chailletii]|nr:cytochrome P450 [Amylostereum chailletii]